MRMWLAAKVLSYGHSLLKAGKFEGARWCVALLKRLKSTGRFELGAAIAFREGDSSRAVEILRKPADEFPQVWILNSMLGQGFSDQGAYASARERFERVYAQVGPRGGALYNLAVVAAREGDHKEALTLLDRSVGEKEPVREARIVEARGYSLLKLGRLPEAEAALHGSDSPKAMATRALVLARRGREAEAWAAIRDVFRIDPGYAEAWEATRVLLGGAASREYRVLLDGLIDPETHPLKRRYGFFAVAWINADDEAEALEIARRVEPDLLDLRIAESTWDPVGSDPRRGYVARRKGHTLYTDLSEWKAKGTF